MEKTEMTMTRSTDDSLVNHDKNVASHYDHVVNETPTASPLHRTRAQKTKHILRRFWWAFLFAFLLGVLGMTLIL